MSPQAETPPARRPSASGASDPAGSAAPTESAEALLPAGENAAVYATGISLPLAAPSLAQTEAGSPREGLVPLGRIGAVDVDLWELRTGTVTDVELEEMFVVLSGNATIEFLDEDRSLVVGAGDVVRLTAGSRTRWTVLDHIRKVAVSLPAG
ncbi:cupin domain-containing protein [Leucobacter sp. M11]|uniref:cupin domain-containing protein n=1 Tax=Leucobacter sp. M11 TaxID=2993565 RepID=UPI002D7E668A|nr:cupin domain-containing protein [Leucobacter sp. M11]MEB4614112.1 cupin domain-containing protein [Leucobacter sp. M11]